VNLNIVNLFVILKFDIPTIVNIAIKTNSISLNEHVIISDVKNNDGKHNIIYNMKF
jgi:hypothetical protein